jgi:ABC-type phosphate/phosphonate transport system substrate-binding protein
MIANARMYSVSPQAGELWRSLLGAVSGHAGLEVQVLEHPPPAPIEQLWEREDKAAVFMCGLPFSRSSPQPQLIAAPVPSPPDFRGLPQYWSELVVRKDSSFERIEDTFGTRLALTAPDSQSGCLAALYYLMNRTTTFPLYKEVVAPQITPLGAMSAVINGSAEVAPIDSYAHRLLQKYRAELTCEVRVIARTEPTPIPPLVASIEGLNTLQSALLHAHEMPGIADLMNDLLLERFVRADPKSYDALRLNFETATSYWQEHHLARSTHQDFATRLARFTP